MEQHYNISTIKCKRNDKSNIIDPSTVTFDIASINDRVINSVNIKQTDNIVQSDSMISSVERKKPHVNDKLDKRILDIGDDDVSIPNAFQ